MTEQEINRGLLLLDPQHAFYRAVCALFENLVEAEQLAVATPDLTDGARHYNAGRLALAVSVKNLIPDRMKECLEAERKRQEREKWQAERDAAQSRK